MGLMCMHVGIYFEKHKQTNKQINEQRIEMRFGQTVERVKSHMTHTYSSHNVWQRMAISHRKKKQTNYDMTFMV